MHVRVRLARVVERRPRFAILVFVVAIALCAGWMARGAASHLTTVEDAWVYLAAGIALAAAGLALAHSRPLLGAAVLIAAVGPVVPNRRGGPSSFAPELQLVGLGALAATLTLVVGYAIRKLVTPPVIVVGASADVHRAQVLDFSAALAEVDDAPRTCFAAVCLCGWAGEGRATPGEAFGDARGHTADVDERIGRPRRVDIVAIDR